MNAIATIAALTVTEAIRRRLVLAFVAITVGIVGLSAWGFDRLSHAHELTSGETNVAVPEALILFMFMFSFVLALSASAIASPSISSEIESGVLMTIVTRPIRRIEVLLGKWIGLAALLAGYAGGVCVLEFAVVRLASGFLPPNPVLAGVYLFAEAALLLTLALFLSTQVPVIAAGVIGVAVFGAGWLAGVVGTLGTTLNIAALRTIGQIGRLLLPTDGLWHAATRSSARTSPTAHATTRSPHKRHHPGPTSYGWPAGCCSSCSPAWRASSVASYEKLNLHDPGPRGCSVTDRAVDRGGSALWRDVTVL
ncbi:MAG: ABC transporter permease subunit [Solirubrobacteraceae bacterium]